MISGVNVGYVDKVVLNQNYPVLIMKINEWLNNNIFKKPIKYLISIFNLNAFIEELGKNICSFERPLLFFSRQKLVWLLKEALNVRREAVFI